MNAIGAEAAEIGRQRPLKKKTTDCSKRLDSSMGTSRLVAEHSHSARLVGENEETNTHTRSCGQYIGPDGGTIDRSRLARKTDDQNDRLESLALKLILLAGQRPGEVRAMHRKHIVDGFWQLPGSPDPK
ncbi:MAG: hypothetical protein WA366_04425, partial [Pseudolabrys sp.]